jgi:hypothetical protein
MRLYTNLGTKYLAIKIIIFIVHKYIFYKNILTKDNPSIPSSLKASMKEKPEKFETYEALKKTYISKNQSQTP